MSEAVDEFACVVDLLPEGAVPEAAIRVVSYLDAEGVQSFSWQTHGDLQMSAEVGLLKLALADRIHKYLHTTDRAGFGDDDDLGPADRDEGGR